MAQSTDLVKLRSTLDDLLKDGYKSEALLLVGVAKRFSACDADSLADAVTFLLRSSYVASGSNWRKAKTPEEAEETLQQWLNTSRRRRDRLLHRAQRGRPIDTLNQYEIAEWIEDAAKTQENSVVQQLFPLLRRDSFSEERWFELERCFGGVQRASTELAAELELLEKQAEELRERLRSLETEIQAKRDGLRRVTGRARAQAEVEGETRGRRRRLRFTGIVIRAGGQEGSINSVVRALRIVGKEVSGVDSERGMKMLLGKGYSIEVVRGTGVVPSGTVFSTIEDLQ